MRSRVDRGCDSTWDGWDAAVAVALGVLAALLRWGPLGPSSLWFDDAWLSLVHRSDGPIDVLRVGVTAPGFAAGLWAVLRVAGLSETAAQALPFAVGVAGPAAVYLAGRRLGLGRAGAVVAGAVLLVSPVHVTYASRVKAYTTDALLGAGLLVAGWRVVERPAAARRWAVLAGAGAAAVVVSAATAPTVAAGFLAGGLAAWTARPRRLAPAVRAGAGFGAFALVWWGAVIRPASTDPLRGYWDGFYLTHGPWRALVGVVDGLSAVAPVVVLLALAVAAAVVAARRPLLAVLLVTPLVVTAALAGLQLVPLGGGRTDSHLYPSLALLLGAGVVEVARRRQVVTAAVATVVVAALAVTVREPDPYPAEDLRPLVEAVERQAEPGDVVAVYPAARWAFALYTSSPVDIRRDATSANGFAAPVRDPDVQVLRPHRDDPAAHGPPVHALTAGADRIWLLASHIAPDLQAIEAFLREDGFEPVRTTTRPGATLTLWERA